MDILRQRWENLQNCGQLNDFLLLTIKEAIDEHLFGPIPPRLEVRPRLGDFVAIATGARCLVTGKEAQKFRFSSCPCRQGAHGSLLPEEMSIPLIIVTPESEQ